MNVVGIVAEYNPFHNGHLYHLEESKRITNADFSVVVMSGNYVQRGEPAIVDKWTRTKMALEAGVDLVIELPVLYASSSAESFSLAAVRLLHHMGIVDSICFGSELGDLSLLRQIADILVAEPTSYQELLKKELEAGLVYPKARANALLQYLPRQGICKLDENLESVLSSPNNILGIEYLKALKITGSSIHPYTLCRKAAAYHSTEITGTIASATAIRKTLNQNTTDSDSIFHAIPEVCVHTFLASLDVHGGPIGFDNYSHLLHYLLRISTKEDLRTFLDIGEGLENRIYDAANRAFEISGLAREIKTKRYTLTRIQRALLHILLQIKRSDFDFYESLGGPQYIRILGFRENSKDLLSVLKQKASLPLVSNIKKASTHLDAAGQKMLQQEIQSTDIYYLGASNNRYKKTGIELTSSMVIAK